MYNRKLRKQTLLGNKNKKKIYIKKNKIIKLKTENFHIMRQKFT